MNEDIPRLKAALRERLRASVRKLAAAEREAASAQIRRRLQEQPAWRGAECLLCFAPLADEPDVWPLVVEALAAGRAVALPRYCPARAGYVACLITEPERHLRPGRFGVREPVESQPAVDLNRLDFVLAPGVGFHPNGSRLGRGQGYYDRLLAQVPGLKCGVAFDCQVTVEVPAEPHDIQVDCIVTPTRWHWVKRGGRS